MSFWSSSIELSDDDDEEESELEDESRRPDKLLFLCRFLSVQSREFERDLCLCDFFLELELDERDLTKRNREMFTF